MMYWVKLILISIFLILCILLGWWILVGKSQSYTLAEIFSFWGVLSLGAIVTILFPVFVDEVLHRSSEAGFMMYWVKLILISIFLILCFLLGLWMFVGKSEGVPIEDAFSGLGVLSLKAIVVFSFLAFVDGVLSRIFRISPENEVSTASSASSNAAVNNNNLSRNNNATVNNNRSRSVEAANGRRRIVENGSDVRNDAPQLSDNDSIIGHRRLDL